MAADGFGADFDLAQATGEPAFTVDLDGFEGPLDLLLELARRQRVDLARISILALAEQYLLLRRSRAQIAPRACRRLSGHGGVARLSQVSSASSRCPQEPAELDAPALAEGLAQRLRALAAIRKAGEHLMSRPSPGARFLRQGRTGSRRDVGPHLLPRQPLRPVGGLCAAGSAPCARARALQGARGLVARRGAPGSLTRLVGAQADWTAFDDFLLEACADSGMRRSARASTFAASLELAREGKIEMRQERAFAPIWLRPTELDPGEERAA